MNPELNREYPEPDETRLIEEMVAVAVERMKPQDGRIRRGQHAKATGCVRGVFTIRDDVLADLRYGVFRQPKQSFQAVVRFSNSAETMDSDRTLAARGIAIKPRRRFASRSCLLLVSPPHNPYSLDATGEINVSLQKFHLDDRCVCNL